MKINYTVHIGTYRYELTQRKYSWVGEGEARQIQVKENIVSYHDKLDEALKEMNRLIDETPDDLYLYADERRKAKTHKSL